MSRGPWGVSLLPLLVACGAPLADARYSGEPLLTLQGEILMDAPLEADADDLALALFWTFQQGQPIDASEYLRTETTFPSRYTLQLYLPPAETVFSLTHTGQAFAAAYPILYLDRDHNRQWSPDVDPVVGSTDRVYVFYTEDGFSTLDGEPLFDPGYAGVELGKCEDGRVPFIPTGTDDVTLHIGPNFLDTLRDLNCNGLLDEWEGLCTDDCSTE